MTSFREVNYRLRPAKAVERKMMCEALHELRAFRPLSEYQYVGLGSIYYSDFILIHRQLGISKMISFESSAGDRPRFEHNLPFGCIDLRMGDSKDLLPLIDWTIPFVAWMDYDGQLSPDVLTDVRTVSMHAQPGDVLIVSLNAVPLLPETDSDEVKALNVFEKRLYALKERFGEDLPYDLAPADMKGNWAFAEVCRKMLRARINATLSERSGTQSVGVAQVFSFHYNDGCEMMTIGWVFHDDATKPHLNKFDKSRMKYLRSEGEPAYFVRVPNLTLREVRALDAKIPLRDKDVRRFGWLPESDVRAYEEIYRFFPVFAETEL